MVTLLYRLNGTTDMCIWLAYAIQYKSHYTKHAGHDSGDIKAGSISSHHDATWHPQHQEPGQHSRADPVLDSMPYSRHSHLWGGMHLHTDIQLTRMRCCGLWGAC